MKFIPVVSSMVAAVKYSPDSGRLVVQFPGDGQTVYWEYLGVPHSLVLQFLFADSLGRAFALLIKKGGFENRRVTPQQAHSED